MLDASAVLALLFDEPGADVVDQLVSGALISAINWAEVHQRIPERGGDPSTAREGLIQAGVRLVPLSVDDAEVAAALRGPTRALGLSLADRCCLALAQRTGRPAVTADRTWAGLAGTVDVQLIR